MPPAPRTAVRLGVPPPPPVNSGDYPPPFPPEQRTAEKSQEKRQAGILGNGGRGGGGGVGRCKDIEYGVYRAPLPDNCCSPVRAPMVRRMDAAVPCDPKRSIQVDVVVGPVNQTSWVSSWVVRLG